MREITLIPANYRKGKLIPAPFSHPAPYSHLRAVNPTRIALNSFTALVTLLEYRKPPRNAIQRI